MLAAWYHAPSSAAGGPGPRNHVLETINELHDYRDRIAHWWTGRLDASYADDIQPTVVKLLRSTYGLWD